MNKYPPPERRGHPRVKLPILFLHIAGRRYPTVDWSLNGFSLEAPGLAPGPDGCLRGWVELPYGADGEFQAELVADQPGDLTRLHLRSISERALAAMKELDRC